MDKRGVTKVAPFFCLKIEIRKVIGDIMNANCWKPKERTLTQMLEDVMPRYLASYLIWYYSDPKKRVTWEELCKTDTNFKTSAGTFKTEEFAEQNWLIRADVQKGMIIYLKYMKNYNIMKVYQSMLKKALEGDVNACKYIDTVNQSDLLTDTNDEWDSFMKGVDINGIKG